MLKLACKVLAATALCCCTSLVDVTADQHARSLHSGTPRGARRRQLQDVYAFGHMGGMRSSKSAAPSQAPSVSSSPTTSPAPSNAPSTSPTLYPTRTPTRTPTAAPTVSAQPTAPDFETTSTLTEAGRTDYSSACEKEIPADLQENIALQLFSFQYRMYVAPETQPVLKVEKLEEQMHKALANFFLTCNYIEVRDVYVHSIQSNPPDELSGECKTEDPSADLLCYSAMAHFTAEIVYGAGRRNLQTTTTTLVDPQLTKDFGDFLMKLLDGQTLLDDRLDLLVFEGFTNLYSEATFGGGATTTSSDRGSTTVAGATVEVEATEKSPFMNIVPYLAIGLAVLTLVLAFLLVLRVKKRRQEKLCHGGPPYPNDELVAQRTLEESVLSEDDNEIVVLSDRGMQELNDLRAFEEDLRETRTNFEVDEVFLPNTDSLQSLDLYSHLTLASPEFVISNQTRRPPRKKRTKQRQATKLYQGNDDFDDFAPRDYEPYMAPNTVVL